MCTDLCFIFNKNIITMTLCLLLSGSASVILSRLDGFGRDLRENALQDSAARENAQDVVVVKVDEKIVASLRQMIALVRSAAPNGKGYDRVVWGCKALQFQRFQVMMHFAIFCSPARRGVIADEEGAVRRFRSAAFLLWECPRFVGECCAGLVVALWSLLTLPRLLRRFSHSHSHSQRVR
jgi:hypothetical protein